MNVYGFETETAEGAARLRAGLAVAAGVYAATVDGAALGLSDRLTGPLVGPAAARQSRQALASVLCRRLAAASACRVCCEAAPSRGSPWVLSPTP